MRFRRVVELPQDGHARPIAARLAFRDGADSRRRDAERLQRCFDPRGLLLELWGRADHSEGERVRTAKDARAVVQLSDGSAIEMKDRSELYLTKNGSGTTIHLSRGNIVVEAAKL